jgi:hypothetical protein
LALTSPLIKPKAQSSQTSLGPILFGPPTSVQAQFDLGFPKIQGPTEMGLRHIQISPQLSLPPVPTRRCSVSEHMAKSSTRTRRQCPFSWTH